jgi:hypothetical protein
MAAEGPVQQNLEGSHALDLAPLHLVQGDTVRVTAWAMDDRGRREGKSTAADSPLVFRVTDEQGILAGVSEGDKQSARELNDMLKRLLELGDAP